MALRVKVSRPVVSDSDLDIRGLAIVLQEFEHDLMRTMINMVAADELIGWESPSNMRNLANRIDTEKDLVKKAVLCAVVQNFIDDNK